MTSAIDATLPVAGSPTTQSVRDNFAAAKAEITALQAAIPASVKTYGAVGDGSTADLAAFQAAEAALDTIYVPVGTYRLTSPMALNPAKLYYGTGILKFDTATVWRRGGSAGTGNPEKYTLIYEYSSQSDVSLTIDGVAQTISWIDAFTIQAPASTTAQSVIITIANGTLRLGSVPQSIRALNMLGTAVPNLAPAQASPTATWTGFDNTALGSRALLAATTADNATAVGSRAARSLTTANNVTAIGFQAAYRANADANTAVGSIAGEWLTTGGDNTLIGATAGAKLTTGASNTAVGSTSLAGSQTASFLTAVGYRAMGGVLETATPTNSTAVGAFAADQLDGNAQGNTAVGYRALCGNSNSNTGTFNVAAGYFAARNNSSGSSNVSIGVAAGQNNTTGSNNIYIGFQAGQANTTGSGNIIIGYQAYQGQTTPSNALVIANQSGTPFLLGNMAGPGSSSNSLTLDGTLNAKLRDFVSVKDYGATGDGTTDDTTAVQAALTAAATSGKAVCLPAGTYRLTAGLTAAAVLLRGEGTQSVLLFDNIGTGVNGITFTPAAADRTAGCTDLAILVKTSNGGSAIKTAQNSTQYTTNRSKYVFRDLLIAGATAPTTPLGFERAESWTVGLDIGDAWMVDIQGIDAYGNFRIDQDPTGQLQSAFIRTNANGAVLTLRADTVTCTSFYRGVEIGTKTFFQIQKFDLAHCYDGIYQTTTVNAYSESKLAQGNINAQRYGVFFSTISTREITGVVVRRHKDGWKSGATNWVGFSLDACNQVWLSACMAQPDESAGAFPGTQYGISSVAGSGLVVTGFIAGANLDYGIYADNCTMLTVDDTVSLQNAAGDTLFRLVNNTRNSGLGAYNLVSTFAGTVYGDDGSIGATVTQRLPVGATVAGNILPDATVTRNLGSSSVRWSTVYASSFSASGSMSTPYVAQSVSTAVTAAGTTQATAQALSSSVSVHVVTTAAASSGVTLPSGTAGREVIVLNRGANAVTVYPASGGQIDALGTNVGVSVAVSGKARFVCTASTQWWQV